MTDANPFFNGKRTPSSATRMTEADLFFNRSTAETDLSSNRTEKETGSSDQTSTTQNSADKPTSAGSGAHT